MNLKLFLHEIAVAGSVLVDCIRSLTLLPKNIAAKWRGNVLIQALVRNTSKNIVFGLPRILVMQRQFVIIQKHIFYRATLVMTSN